MASLMSPSHGMFLLSSSPRRSPAPRTVRESPASQSQPLPQQQQQQQQQPQPQLEPDNIEETYQALFCKAMYDYAAQDASALSFRRGDIIEVLNQQPSGWWDGLLGEERGWFPSNYVTLITVEEADLAFSGSDGTAQSDSDTGVLGISDAMMRGQAQNEDWLENQISFVDEYVDNPRVTAVQGSQTNDFWEPNIMEDGRIFYVNSRTGQHSWDLPQETADEISESELAGLSTQGTVRAATGAGMAFGAVATTNGINGTHDIEPAGFGVPRSTGTPEPWIKRLADDGTSYYYINKQTGETLWTRPEVPSTANSSHSDLEDTAPSSTARRPRAGSRSSVYSDDSDVHPLDHPRAPRSAGSERARQQQNQVQLVKKFNLPQSGVSGVVQLTSEEIIAKQLQQALAPPPPELPIDLSSKARDAIQSILNNVHGTIGRAGDDQRMDDLIQAAVRAVRNLLYVSAANTSHIATDVFAKENRERSSSSPLKPAQRRVTATLSRLVLSARAMYYDSGSHVSETLNRIETDAEELERAVALFIAEVQRAQPNGGRTGGSPKRLYGTFTTANIGAGLVGAGSAGTWKGFGWVSQEADEQAPQRPLSQEVAAEVSVMLGKMEDMFAHLAQALVSLKDGPVEQLRQLVQDLVSYISHFIRFVADIHIARHVDIDGIQQTGDTMDDMYAQTLTKARSHVRTLETAFQAAYDDSSSLLLTSQNLLSSDPGCSPEDRMVSLTALESSTSSLRANLFLVRETLEALLSVGHEQADIAQGDYNGSIEWRMSRLSVIHSQFGGAARTSQEFSNGLEEEDAMVEFDDVLTRPIPPAKPFRPSVDTLVDPTRPSVESVERASTSAGESYTDVSALGTVTAEDDTIDEELMDIDRPKKPAQPKKKLDSILGPEYVDKVAAESQPWYLRSNYNPSEIVIDEGDNSVKAGTVPALVEKLTAHNQVDLPYSRAFLMTYKDFTTLDNLFDLLVQRFRTQPPENLTPKELEQWTKLKQHVIRTRVLNTFKNMITEQYVLDRDDMYILGRMKDFISQDDVAVMPAAKALRSLIERAQSNGEVSIQSFVTTNQIPAPTPIIPRISKKLKLLDIDPLELARQLTVMESRMYQRIKPIEALRRARAQKVEIVDNIGIVIQTSNRIADWVADSILRKEDSKKRAQVVKYLINVADRCRILNNFSTMIAITSGLNTPPIRRLKRTWEQVNQRVIAQFAACEVTIDSSKTFAKYRHLMSSVTPPCVPFIGVFLSTLQFIIDGNPDNLPADQLVNFFKRQKASEVMDDIKRWQATPYNLTPVPGILNFIEDSLNQFSNTDTRASSDIFWKLSLEREPREREDEKMARLLQESGFL